VWRQADGESMSQESLTGHVASTVKLVSSHSQVTAAMISEIERGRRLPSVRTWTKLRRGLGIEAPLSILTRQPVPTEVVESQLIRLGARLLASGGRVWIPDLGQTLGLSAAAVREQLPKVTPRLAACGFQITTDGLEVQVEPLEVAEAPGTPRHGPLTNRLETFSRAPTRATTHGRLRTTTPPVSPALLSVRTEASTPRPCTRQQACCRASISQANRRQLTLHVRAGRSGGVERTDDQ
jgi:transcriptional regulator with XRE-family HTH domain